MTEFGLAKIDAAKRSGLWELDSRPVFSQGIPQELAAAFARNWAAKNSFEKLAPSYQRQFIGWLATAKRPETKVRRLKECLALLERGEKLGLK